MKKMNFTTKYILIMSLIVLAVGGFFALKSLNATQDIGTTGVIKDNEYYSLRKNATGYQKTVYKELSKAVKDEEQGDDMVSALIAKNFIADFYTWSNKLRLNDVGGLQFLEPSMVPWVSHQAQETFYQDMYYYLDRNEISDSLTVKNIETTVEVKEIDDPVEGWITGYFVDANWTYEESDVLNINTYENSAKIRILKDKETGKFMIVEVASDET